jgi:hypothetical protein
MDMEKLTNGIKLLGMEFHLEYAYVSLLCGIMIMH